MRFFNERLIHAMNISGTKQIELAKAAGVSRAAVTSWVRGDVQSIGGDSLIAVANVLGVNPKWLATGEGAMRNQWPFQKIKPSDFDVLPKEVVQDLEDIINLQISKYKKLDDKKAS
ncbi:hypothetical protein CEQ07_03890 [Oligella urethralis]|uniref:helix-turn-helix domain-containing protein n=1 Tax=Oligella urethralis TaxID=90245 RepID=UPI000D008E10|nr:helix-turn-helix domain-containing protein [Oligella urethralis]AVL70645.1 hypothetical protein CEQ07_03890 [Oligella urethralis]